jgi:hypothetical protein
LPFCLFYFSSCFSSHFYIKKGEKKKQQKKVGESKARAKIESKWIRGDRSHKKISSLGRGAGYFLIYTLVQYTIHTSWCVGFIFLPAVICLFKGSVQRKLRWV